MNLLIALCVGFSLGWLSREKRARRMRSLIREKQEIIVEQTKVFEEMMDEFNHHSEISPAATFVGLIGSTIYRMREKLLKPLRELTDKPDRRLRDIISETEGLLNGEMSWQLMTADTWLKKARAFLKQYERHQFLPGSPQNPSKDKAQSK